MLLKDIIPLVDTPVNETRVPPRLAVSIALRSHLDPRGYSDYTEAISGRAAELIDARMRVGKAIGKALSEIAELKALAKNYDLVATLGEEASLHLSPIDHVGTFRLLKEVDWEAGTYGDRKSCFFKSTPLARVRTWEDGAIYGFNKSPHFAALTTKDKKGKPYSRAFVMQTARHDLFVFNGYSVDGVRPTTNSAAVLASHLTHTEGVPHTIARVKARLTQRDSYSGFHINSGAGVLVFRSDKVPGDTAVLRHMRNGSIDKRDVCLTCGGLHGSKSLKVWSSPTDHQMIMCLDSPPDGMDVKNLSYFCEYYINGSQCRARFGPSVNVAYPNGYYCPDCIARISDLRYRRFVERYAEQEEARVRAHRARAKV